MVTLVFQTMQSKNILKIIPALPIQKIFWKLIKVKMQIVNSTRNKLHKKLFLASNIKYNFSVLVREIDYM